MAGRGQDAFQECVGVAFAAVDGIIDDPLQCGAGLKRPTIRVGREMASNLDITRCRYAHESCMSQGNIAGQCKIAGELVSGKDDAGRRGRDIHEVGP